MRIKYEHAQKLKSSNISSVTVRISGIPESELKDYNYWEYPKKNSGNWRKKSGAIEY